MRTQALFAVVVLTLCMTLACDDEPSSPSIPTTPSPPVAPAAGPTVAPSQCASVNWTIPAFVDTVCHTRNPPPPTDISRPYRFENGCSIL